MSQPPQSSATWAQLAREVCEVVMSNKLINQQFGGPDKEVEVDEHAENIIKVPIQYV